MTEPKSLTIKTFAEFAGVPYSTIRYYDEIGLLTPASRGDENNYRYYDPMQLKTLNFIEVLVGLGIPLATIKEIAQDRTPDAVIEMLRRQETILDYKLEDLRTAYSIIHAFRSNIQGGILAKDGEVRVERLDELRYVLGPSNDVKRGRIDFDAFKHFCDSAEDYRINLRYPVGRYYCDMISFISDASQPDRYFSSDPMGNCIREEGKYLVGYKRGFDDDFEDIIEKMSHCADEHGLFFTGPVYVRYLLDEICMTDPAQYLARIAVKVSRDKDCEVCKHHAIHEDCPIEALCVKPHYAL